MVEHLDLCEQFARAFGNDQFERPEPFDKVIYTVTHHDRGWDEAQIRGLLGENFLRVFGKIWGA